VSGYNSLVAKILLVEDDSDFLDRIEEWLKHERYSVDAVADGKAALEKLTFYQYDAVVLDWNLPYVSGVELVQQFRASGGKTPILMLTGRNSVPEKTEGLDAGADDYLTKPFDLNELSARLRALLRRPQEVRANVLKASDLVLNPTTREVTLNDKPISLLPLEYSLLEFFMRHPNHVFSHNVLVERVWKSESNATAEAVRTCVMALRKKISTTGKQSMIRTVHGTGYKFALED
jgi:DNA-binding response OmpR family regulator